MVLGIAVGDEVDTAVAVHVGRLDPGADAGGPTEIAPLPAGPCGLSAIHDEEVTVPIVPTGGGSHFTADDVGETIAIIHVDGIIAGTGSSINGIVSPEEFLYKLDQAFG